MYSFFKKHHSISQVRVSSTHVVRCFKGRCLISSHDANIAVWLYKKDVSYHGDYIKFNIDHNKNYFVSELYRMLAEDEYQQEEEAFKGSSLVALFMHKKKQLNVETSTLSLN